MPAAETTENACLDVALEAASCGISVLPPFEDGSKRPITTNGKWDMWQKKAANESQIRRWYSNGRRGVGFVCGSVSGNLELFEFDDWLTYISFKTDAKRAGLQPLIERIERGYSETTPGGGVHWLYRFPGTPKGVKLACRPGDGILVDTLIETKGEGGYVVVAPSGGSVHETGEDYKLLNGAVATVPTITLEERQTLWELARGFDQMPSRNQIREVLTPLAHDEASPGNDFKARASWEDILPKHGWTQLYTRNEITYWRRPGKEEGISATTNYAGSDLFYPFTSSTIFDRDRGYNKFSVYALLECNGDFHTAARELAHKGYGARPVGLVMKSANLNSSSIENNNQEEIIPEKSRYTLHHADEALVPQPPIEWVVDALFACGSVGLIVGAPGAKKTYSLLDCAVCTALGEPWLGRTTKQGPVLLIDEESGPRRLNRRLSEVMHGHGAGLGTPIWYTTLEMFNMLENGDIRAIDEIMTEVHPVLVIIDALADVMPGGDENAVKDTHPVFQRLRALADAHSAAMEVIHHANKAGSYRGSTAIAGAVDLMLMVDSEKDSSKISYTTTKARDTEPQSFGASITFDVIGGRTYLMSDETVAVPKGEFSKAQQYVIRWLLAQQISNLADIESNADICSGNTARLATYNLVERGYVRRADDGRRGEKASYEICPDRLSKLSKLSQYTT